MAILLPYSKPVYLASGHRAVTTTTYPTPPLPPLYTLPWYNNWARALFIYLFKLRVHLVRLITS